MEVARLLAILRRWWWLLLLGVAVGGSAGFAVSKAMTPVYRASTTLLVNQTQTPGVIAYNDILTSERLTQTYRELVTKRPVLEDVIKTAGEPLDVDTLRGMLSVSVIRDTQLLRLSVESTDPSQAAALANATARSFIHQNQDSDLSRPGSVSVVEPATEPTVPVTPRTKLNVVLGIVLALLATGSLILLMEYLDDTVKSEQEVERVTGLATLGMVWRFGRKKMRQPLSGYESSNPAAEAYRSLRTSVQFATVDRPGQVLLVTSPNAGDGKSTTAANLAVTTASVGKRVVLVDADLRKPALHQFFDLENGLGLTSALLSGNGARPLLQPTGFDNLSVLTSGPLPPNPSELLSSSRMRDLMHALRKEVDVIILDSPPALAVTDATVLAAVADGTILVVISGRTRLAALRRAVGALTRATDQVLGVVLNKAGRRGTHSYYYRYYHGYYSSDEPARRSGTRRALVPDSGDEPLRGKEPVV